MCCCIIIYITLYSEPMYIMVTLSCWGCFALLSALRYETAAMAINGDVQQGAAMSERQREGERDKKRERKRERVAQSVCLAERTLAPCTDWLLWRNDETEPKKNGFFLSPSFLFFFLKSSYTFFFCHYCGARTEQEVEKP